MMVHVKQFEELGSPNWVAYQYWVKGIEQDIE